MLAQGERRPRGFVGWWWDSPFSRSRNARSEPVPSSRLGEDLAWSTCLFTWECGVGGGCLDGRCSNPSTEYSGTALEACNVSSV